MTIHQPGTFDKYRAMLAVWQARDGHLPGSGAGAVPPCAGAEPGRARLRRDHAGSGQRGGGMSRGRRAQGSAGGGALSPGRRMGAGGDRG